MRFLQNNQYECKLDMGLLSASNGKACLPHTELRALWIIPVWPLGPLVSLPFQRCDCVSKHLLQKNAVDVLSIGAIRRNEYPCFGVVRPAPTSSCPYHALFCRRLHRKASVVGNS